MNGLSIVIPIYKEKKNLSRLITLIYKFVKIKNFELIFIDDDSKDGSDKIIKEFKKEFKNLKFFIRKKKPRDLSRSCIMGFKKTNFTNILVMDGDLQHRPVDINKLYKKIVNEDCDIVVGSRELTKKKNEGLRVHRLISSIILIFIVNIFLGFKTNDPMSGFFIFKKKIFFENEKKLTAKGYKILFDLIYAQKKPIKIRDIFIKFNSREKGFSKMDYKVIYLLLKDIVKKFLFG